MLLFIFFENLLDSHVYFWKLFWNILIIFLIFIGRFFLFFILWSLLFIFIICLVILLWRIFLISLFFRNFFLFFLLLANHSVFYYTHFLSCSVSNHWEFLRSALIFQFDFFYSSNDFPIFRNLFDKWKSYRIFIYGKFPWELLLAFISVGLDFWAINVISW